MVLEDVDRACAVTAGVEYDYYSKIYYSSNEYLDELFQHFSVKDKDVLTVLGSSDQLFHAYHHGAYKVDTFDINCLTKYYHYLRRWRILYENHYYLPDNIFRSHRSLEKLLRKVKCRDEEESEAVLFWKEFLSRMNPSKCSDLYCYIKPSNKIQRLKTIREQLTKQDFTFYNFNLFDTVSCNRKYDVIITSNVLEYGQNSLRLVKGRDNLNKLLRRGGQVVCSHFIFSSLSVPFLDEREIFEENFDYYEFPKSKNSFPLGYTYVKKC